MLNTCIDSGRMVFSSDIPQASWEQSYTTSCADIGSGSWQCTDTLSAGSGTAAAGDGSTDGY